MGLGTWARAWWRLTVGLAESPDAWAAVAILAGVLVIAAAFKLAWWG